MTMEAIKRAIKKGTGELGSSKLPEDLTYEGYATGGVAVVVEALSDNRNRTAPEMRKLFERGGGSLGAPGCVGWQFHRKATFMLSGTDEDSVMEVLLEADADAEDIVGLEDGGVSITAEADQFDIIKDALEAASITIDSSDVTKLPETDAEVSDLDTAQKVQKLLDALEEHDDVTEVFSNFAPTAEVAEQL